MILQPWPIITVPGHSRLEFGHCGLDKGVLSHALAFAYTTKEENFVGEYLTVSEPAYPKRKVTILLEAANDVDTCPDFEPLEKVIIYKADRRVDGEHCTNEKFTSTQFRPFLSVLWTILQ